MEITKIKLDLIALLVAVIALGTSMRSCMIADEALLLQEKQFVRQTNTIWKSSYKDKAIYIAPSNPSVTLQKAYAYYPSSITDDRWPIETPDYKLHITVPIISIQELVEERIEKKAGITTILDEARIPVVIHSFYTINGESFEDKSLYLLEYLAMVQDEEFKDPYVEIKGLIYNSRLNIDIAPHDYLDEVWGVKKLNK